MFWVIFSTVNEVAVPKTVVEVAVSYQLHCKLLPEGKVTVKMPSVPGHTCVVLPAVGAEGNAFTVTVTVVLLPLSQPVAVLRVLT